MCVCVWKTTYKYLYVKDNYKEENYDEVIEVFVSTSFHPLGLHATKLKFKSMRLHILRTEIGR